MNIRIEKILIIIVLLSLSEKLVAQKTSDAEFLFKTWLFLEHNNTKSRDAVQFISKDSSVFNLLLNNIDLRFDTLKTKGFVKDYIFLSLVVVGQNNVLKTSGIKYKKYKFLGFIGIPENNCEAYVLCINKSKGTSYRIKGFYGNDFLGLLHEIQVYYLDDKKKKLAIKQFLKDYTVEGLDFECLFEGLTSNESDFNKFPCLKNCSDAIITVH